MQAPLRWVAAIFSARKAVVAGVYRRIATIAPSAYSPAIALAECGADAVAIMLTLAATVFTDAFDTSVAHSRAALVRVTGKR